MQLNFLILFLGLVVFSPVFGQESDEAYKERVLKEYSKRSAPMEESQIDEVIEQDIAEAPEDFNEPEPSNVKIQDSFLTKIMNKGAKEYVRRFLNQNPFSNMSRSELRSLVLARLEGQPFGNFLKERPKFLDMFVDILRDRKALPSLHDQQT